MIFLLPFMAAKAVAATITVGEVIGIGATALGIGAGIKGAVDYQKAKKLKAEAEAEYQEMAHRIRRRAAKLKKNSQRLAA
ncbi:MAG: hypothetical protein FWD13_04165 [Treponema sp.]|nr:hypothetical protein [Treponema sp.]